MSTELRKRLARALWELRSEGQASARKFDPSASPREFETFTMHQERLRLARKLRRMRKRK